MVPTINSVGWLRQWSRTVCGSGSGLRPILGGLSELYVEIEVVRARVGHAGGRKREREETTEASWRQGAGGHGWGTAMPVAEYITATMLRFR